VQPKALGSVRKGGAVRREGLLTARFGLVAHVAGLSPCLLFPLSWWRWGEDEGKGKAVMSSILMGCDLGTQRAFCSNPHS